MYVTVARLQDSASARNFYSREGWKSSCKMNRLELLKPQVTELRGTEPKAENQ